LTVAAGNADGSARVYILDEDGDGCFIWEDAAPLDPTTCTVPPKVSSSFIETWGLPLFAGGVGVVALLLVAAARRSNYAAYAGNGGRRGSRGNGKNGKDRKGKPGPDKGRQERTSRPRDRR